MGFASHVLQMGLTVEIKTGFQNATAGAENKNDHCAIFEDFLKRQKSGWHTAVKR